MKVVPTWKKFEKRCPRNWSRIPCDPWNTLWEPQC